MKSILSALMLTAFFIPTATAAAEFNAGFVQGLWYSDEHLVDEKTIRIYVALRNNTKHDLTGTVRFEDGTLRIGSTEVRALPGRLVEAWIDWQPTYGEHTLRAILADVRLHPVGAPPESGDAQSTLAEDTVFVDYDTDKDGMPNEFDDDDDGDGVSDEEEIGAGTDPLIFDEPEEEENEDEENSASNNDEGSEQNIRGTEIVETELASATGLERYVGEGTLHNTLSNISQTTNSAKATLDTYRERRKAEMEAEREEKARERTENSQAGDTATITRTQMEKRPGIFTTLYSAVAGLFNTFYTLILWLTSKLLGHPAIVQLLLLFAILVVVYKLARKIGRRPQ